MKNQLSLFVATLATLFSFLSASAQGEWKWANYWSGTGGSSANIFNTITRTAFDEEGNIYVLGEVGGQSTFNGLTFQFINNPQVFGSPDRTSMLAKFDTLGNMLWYKIMKASTGSVCFAHWMEVKDGKVYMSGNCELDEVDNIITMGGVWLYYFDTLITGQQVHAIPIEQRQPPYKAGRYTYFATFDLDGNLIDNHFVEALSRRISAGGVRGQEYLCSGNGIGINPMHVDEDGNTYVYTRLSYDGLESDPYTIIIDNDSNKTYDIYLPRSGWGLNMGMKYKFSPNWELIYSKPMVDRTEGIAVSWELAGDSVNPVYVLFLESMSFDEADNMYISGHIDLGLFADMGGDLHQYPIHIYWDSTHYLSMQDISSTDATSFIIKYDTDGEVLWCNQLYTTGSDNPGAQNFAMAAWKGSCYKDNYVYITGFGTKTGGNSQVYFDDESHPLLFYTDNRPQTGFFVKYDASTGQYVNQGIIPAEIATPGQFPAVVNNRVFSFANSNYGSRIYQWGIDGTYINEININSVNNIDLPSTSIIVDDIGNLLLGFSTTSSGSLGNGVSFGSPTGSSSAVFALYYNPEFAQPFVPDDSVGIDEYYQNRERDIYISPNPTSGPTSVHGYMYGYQSIELYDLQGRKLADLVEAWQPSNASTMQPIPAFDLSPYPSGTYLVKINFERGVSVVRKVVKS